MALWGPSWQKSCIALPLKDEQRVQRGRDSSSPAFVKGQPKVTDSQSSYPVLAQYYATLVLHKSVILEANPVARGPESFETRIKFVKNSRRTVSRKHAIPREGSVGRG